MTLFDTLEKYLDKNFINELSEAMDCERTNSLILNTNKMSKEDFISEFSEVQKHPFIENVFYFNKKQYELGKSYLFDNGVYYIMDASSLLVAHFLPVKDGDLILDMCAAPGGKTISLALNNLDKNISIISNDISYNRTLDLSNNIEKIGLPNIAVINNDFSKNYQKFPNKFDVIILDAPCSGSAMFRKNELAFKDWSLQKVLSLKIKQVELLKEAIYMLNNDGYISYSTCSFSYEENEEVILEILNEFPDIEMVNIPARKEFYKDKNLPESIHLFPNLYKGEGQFIAILHKKGAKIQNTKFKSVGIKHKDILKKYNLDFKNEYFVKDRIYVNNIDFNFDKLNVIRYGLLVGTINKDNFVPDFNLAKHLDSSNSIELNEDEKNRYLHGEELTKNCNLHNGFYIVKYKKLNLGRVKLVNNKLKNYYPKGLRH